MDDATTRPAAGPADGAQPQTGLGWPEFFQSLDQGTASPKRRPRPDAFGGAKARRSGTEA